MKKRLKGYGTTFGLAGASIGMGLVGEGLGSSALTGAGQTTAGFVQPAAAISGAGMTMGMLDELRKTTKKE